MFLRETNLLLFLEIKEKYGKNWVKYYLDYSGPKYEISEVQTTYIYKPTFKIPISKILEIIPQLCLQRIKVCISYKETLYVIIRF